MQRSKRFIVARTLAVAAITGASIATVVVAQDAPPAGAGDPPPAEMAAAQPVSGTVQAYNFGPNGEAEGVMLKVADGSMAQVNFPPHLSDAVTKSAAVGASVKLTASPARKPPRGTPDHAVYELASYTDASGKEIKVGPGQEETGHAEGAVKSLNYDRGGRVNGVVLEDGTLVHFGPEASDQLKLTTGTKVTADGKKKATASGKTVIDADTVNGTTIDRPKPPAGGPKPKGPRDDAGGPPPAPRP